ncbi:MAG: DUF6526 family protein [Flavitalea sp.]
MAQNYKNHTRIHPFYYVVVILCLVLIIGAFRNLFQVADDELYNASLITLASLILPMILVIARLYGLKNQDRAIRAEEKLRYFILAGKPMPASLKMSQIIALRFASDEEFISLAEQSLKESLTAKQIKQRITNWKADYRRV